MSSLNMQVYKQRGKNTEFRKDLLKMENGLKKPAFFSNQPEGAQLAVNSLFWNMAMDNRSKIK